MMRSVFRIVFLPVFVITVLTAPPTTAKWLGGKSPPSQTRQAGSEIILREVHNGNNITVHVGYMVLRDFIRLYSSHISLDRLEVFYVEHELDPTNREECSRITFRQDSFSSDVKLEDLYIKDNQKEVNLISQYFEEKRFYLARGHLAAMADYGAEIDQLCTFYYINTAPQWQSFNNANWKSLEYRVRQRFFDRRYDTVIYTGTFGHLRLFDNTTRREEPVYLDNEKKVKVPLYFYKVVYDRRSMRGTAFIGVNNPFISNLTIAASHEFCTNQCPDGGPFSHWLTWKAKVLEKGYSFCCTVDNFRTTVPHLPPFETKGLLN